MKRFFKGNSLSICFLVLFVLSLVGQTVFGLKEYNKQKLEKAESL